MSNKVYAMITPSELSLFNGESIMIPFNEAVEISKQLEQATKAYKRGSRWPKFQAPKVSIVTIVG